VDDAAAAQLPATARRHRWEHTFAMPAPPEPSLRIRYGPGKDDFTVEAQRDLGLVTLEALDHHRARLAIRTRHVAAGRTRFTLPVPRDENDFWDLELIHVQVGGWHGWSELECGDGCRTMDFGWYRDHPPADE
jgi:hypothetical protein